MTYRYHRSKEMAECVSEVLKSNFQAYQKNDHQLFLHWRKIVGEEFAHLIFPQKLSRGKGAETCLVLGTQSNATSVMVQHLSVQLLDTINGYFGFKFVDRIQFEPYKKVAMPQPYRKPFHPLPSMTMSPTIQESLERLETGPLRDVLTRLGTTLHRRSKNS